MGWLQSIRRALWSVGSSTYDAVHAKNKRQAPTGILRSEDSELPPTERRPRPWLTLPVNDRPQFRRAI